ncbi:MAG: hypothetical protein ACO307_09830, partial [Ilumatobacteraceae bacterium]
SSFLPVDTIGLVKVLRRILTALLMTGVAAAGIRLRGSGGVPPQHGGWRPLDLPGGSDRPPVG